MDAILMQESIHWRKGMRPKAWTSLVCLSVSTSAPIRPTKFKGGTAGKIVVTIAKDRTIDLPVSLKGFSAALNELKKG
jgi:invasion protein IalB